MSIESRVKELAESMGVEEHDVMMLAKSVINSIKKDQAVDAFLNAEEKLGHELTRAYVSDAVSKFNNFHAIYLTRPEARKEFQLNILHELKGGVKE